MMGSRRLMVKYMRQAIFPVCFALALLTLTRPGDSTEKPLELPFEGHQPRVAALPSGHAAVMAFGQSDDVFCTHLDDSASTCSVPVRVAHVPGLMLGMRRGPQVAATTSSLVVTACGASGDLQCWTSADEGRTWSSPVSINEKPGSAREGLTSLARGADNSFYAAWLENRGDGHQVSISHTADGGKSWGANVCVYRSPDGTVCECCQPQIDVRQRDGKVVVMWRNWLGGARDMYVAESNDDAAHFSAAVKLGSGTWPLRACPMDGGGISAEIGTTFTSVWRRENKLYETRGAAPETLVGEGRNAAAAFDSARQVLYTAWQGPQDTILLRTGDQPARQIGKGRYPSLAALPNGGAVIVWESNGRMTATTTI